MVTGKVSARRAAAILNERHSEWQVNAHSLAQACRAHRVTGEVTNDGRYLFDLETLELECAQRRCRYDGCPRVALGESGGCRGHAHVFLGNRRQGLRRPDIGQKISRAKTGSHHSPEARARMAVAKRRYAPERRFCEWCGGQIMPNRPGLEHLDIEELAALDLDLVPGWTIKDGGGRFCSVSHHLQWAWAFERERFAARLGEGASLQHCDICGREVERWPAQLERSKAESWRTTCDVCDVAYRRFRLAAQRAGEKANPRAPLSAATAEAVARIWSIGEQFEVEIKENWPRLRGRRPPLAVDLLILTLFRRGFTDGAICQLINRELGEDGARRIPGVQSMVFDVKYVTLRRQRTNVRRRP